MSFPSLVINAECRSYHLDMIDIYTWNPHGQDWIECVECQDGIYYNLNLARMWVNAPIEQHEIPGLMENWHKENYPDSYFKYFKDRKQKIASLRARMLKPDDARCHDGGGSKNKIALLSARIEYVKRLILIRDDIRERYQLTDEERYAQSLSIVQLFIPGHYKKNRGRLACWGRINGYTYLTGRYFADRERRVVLDIDGNIRSVDFLATSCNSSISYGRFVGR